MIARDLRPISICDGAGFQNFAQALINIGAKYGPLNIKDILQSRQTITRKSLPETYKELKKNLSDEIKPLLKSKSLNFTTDHWESKSKDKYMSLTVHFCNEQLELIERTIGCSQQSEAKTGNLY